MIDLIWQHQIFAGFGFELCLAARATEIIGFGLMIDVMD
ncbi:hypothetical protein O59_003964 [Cellvibrio sp. BR]|nr:hypothetical protein O59_003964 [Cellvibrio sp. BR]